MPARKYNDGDKIGPFHLTIIKRLPQGKANIVCPECGNLNWTPRISDVVNGKSTNCGCLRNKKTAQRNVAQYKDISNQKFGYLIALKPTSKRQNTYVVWDCLCTLCGNHHFANVHDLQKGSVKSCGCWTGSNGEQKIKKILNKMNVEYEVQKTFKGCKNPLTDYTLRFDFYLPKYNCCIEYNGIQHYQVVDYFGGQKHFLETKQRDNIKQQYCKNNNIKLFIISYTDNVEEKIKELFNGESI